MDTAAVLDIGLDALILTAKLAAPVLVTALVVGFAVSLVQSVTQIQEVTLSFVPKAIAAAVALLVCGNWMISELVSFTQELFDRIPSLLGGCPGMDVTLSLAAVQTAMLAGVRFAAFFVVAPPFAHRGIPGTVKAMLSVGLALAVLPRLSGSWCRWCSRPCRRRATSSTCSAGSSSRRRSTRRT